MDYSETTMKPAMTMFDHVLVGGGLQNGLIAWLLLQRDPKARVALVESGASLGGNHTWSFHASDVPSEWRASIAPLIQYAWEGYQVRFPALVRDVPLGYCSLSSGHFHQMLAAVFSAAPNARLYLNTRIASVHTDRVLTDRGSAIYGGTVIDARGPGTAFDQYASEGYQKFVGLEIKLRRPAPIEKPILMDACVPQEDGFRFFYVLPLAPDRVLIEDTRFSDSPRLDLATLQHAVLEYAKQYGYDIREVVRSESGVLPMPFVSRSDWPREMPLRAGFAAGFMHPATGYSFPVALRLACHVAACAPESPLGPAWESLLKHHEQQYRFSTLLNRMLFTAYPPEYRYHIFKRFYGHAVPRISRFYRMEMSVSDMARMFVGRPPHGFSFKRILQGALRP